MADGATTSVLERYHARVAEGLIDADSAQAEAAARLDALARKLVSNGKNGWFSRPERPMGLYLWGGVGRGKSMLMDLFAETAPVSPTRRVHFHAFMQEVHGLINDARSRGLTDPIADAAEKVAAGATLLCFDEMQITDIADAMIVGRLFEALFARGVVIVTTSNRHPDDLYKDGLNRATFLPFIELLKQKLDLHHLAGASDHRQDRLRGEPRYLTPLGPTTTADMDRIWDEAADGPDAPLALKVKGRDVTFARARGRAVRATFEELCARPLGAADFLALAEAADTILIDDIPRLSRAKNNEATRFVHLVDALYEARRLVYVSAEAPPADLYQSGAGAFEFERTASRLEEMQSKDWPPNPPKGG